MDEIIKDARSKNKTLHITFFDLADAFGSVPHELIHHTLERNNFPPQIQKYIKSLYNNTTSIVSTPTFKSEEFSFKRGVFQGDPLSPIIFLLAFNPIIQFLINKSEFGYDLNGKKFITLPYADDFCLISTNLKTHQKFINEIKKSIESMGMMLKPSKCRSFSLKSGSPSVVSFFIGETRISSVSEEEQKFLGKVIFYLGKSTETFDYVKTILMKKLENLNSTMVRDEYKLKIYIIYLLPSIRFLLTINTLTTTHLKKLDTLTAKYLKQWAGLPNCATNSIFHLKYSLNIPSISSFYHEAHHLSHASTRLKGDAEVNHALDSAVNRESNWTRKKSTVVAAEESYNNAVELNVIEGVPIYNGDKNEITKIQKHIRSELQSKNQKEHLSHIQDLIKQGHFLKILGQQNIDATWKSYIFDLKKGTMKFLLNSCLDTLPTKVNLMQWGKCPTDRCKNCQARQTTCHILNCCSTSLNQGRYTWRHNNLLEYMSKCLDKTKFEIYIDIPEHTTPSGGTIPPSLCVTPLKPDLVIIDKKKKTYLLI